MINRIINEIKISLNTNCFIAALTTSLTLPDICGKAAYGEWVNDQQGDKRVYNKMRYVKWYNQYVNKSYDCWYCNGFKQFNCSF